MTSLWLPCVVGSTPNMFITSALVSLACKILLFIAAVLLNYFEVIDTNVFLLWCNDWPTAEMKVREHNTSRTSNTSWTLEICQQPPVEYPPCYDPTSERLFQKIRLCSPPETENIFRLVVLLVVVTSTIASCLAAYNLHKISNYYILWERTKSFCCVSREPLIHRSMIFGLVSDDTNCAKLLNFLGLDSSSEQPLTQSQSQAINRARRGETPYDHAITNGATESARILRKAGAFGSLREAVRLVSNDENCEQLAEFLDIDPLSEQTPTELQIQRANIKREGKTLLQFAAEEGATECGRLLCKAGAKEANTFLIFQLAADDANCEKLTDMLGVDPSLKQPPTEAQIEAANTEWIGESLIQVAARKGAIECAKVICKAGAKNGLTYLAHQLVGNDSNCKKLVDVLGIDSSSQQSPTEAQIEALNNKWQGKTLLQVAAEKGSTECAKLLCQAGAKDTTTYLAYQLVGDDANSEKLADLLGPLTVKSPTKAQIQTVTAWSGEVLLYHAARKEANECVRLLVRAGAGENELLARYTCRGKVNSRTKIFKNNQKRKVESFIESGCCF